MMPRYSVAYVVYATGHMEIEASNLEDARLKAEQEIYNPPLCYQCSRQLDIDDIGEITNIQEL